MAIQDLHGKAEAAEWEAKLEKSVPKSLASHSCLTEVREARLPLPACSPLLPCPSAGALVLRPHLAPSLALLKSYRTGCPAPTQLIISSEMYS